MKIDPNCSRCHGSGKMRAEDLWPFAVYSYTFWYCDECKATERRKLDEKP